MAVGLTSFLLLIVCIYKVNWNIYFGEVDEKFHLIVACEVDIPHVILCLCFKKQLFQNDINIFSSDTITGGFQRRHYYWRLPKLEPLDNCRSHLDAIETYFLSFCVK